MEKAVITVQPGVISPTIPLETIPPEPEYIWMPRPSIDCLQGLEYLGPVDTVKIHYKLDSKDIATDWKTVLSKYILENGKGEQMYYGYEKKTCCEALCCCSDIIKTSIFDCSKKEVLTISWPTEIKCGGCCCCCRSIKPKCTVSTSFGDLGTVEQHIKRLQYYYDVIDDSGNIVFQIEGPTACHLLKCGKREFKIHQGTTVIGEIVQMGLTKETITHHKPICVTSLASPNPTIPLTLLEISSLKSAIGLCLLFTNVNLLICDVCVFGDVTPSCVGDRSFSPFFFGFFFAQPTARAEMSPVIRRIVNSIV
uniref:Phospholipid scramblase n=1 Tax=Caenorhabditis tropicalis TaxID=1561998 RepID=A0A1I7UVB4_9PELO